jgi:hypothetical protein
LGTGRARVRVLRAHRGRRVVRVAAMQRAADRAATRAQRAGGGGSEGGTVRADARDQLPRAAEARLRDTATSWAAFATAAGRAGEASGTTLAVRTGRTAVGALLGRAIAQAARTRSRHLASGACDRRVSAHGDGLRDHLWLSALRWRAAARTGEAAAKAGKAEAAVRKVRNIDGEVRAREFEIAARAQNERQHCATRCVSRPLIRDRMSHGPRLQFRLKHKITRLVYMATRAIHRSFEAQRRALHDRRLRLHARLQVQPEDQATAVPADARLQADP